MAPTTTQTMILSQLAEIQKTLGELGAVTENLRETLRDHTTNTDKHREQVGAALSNTASRLGKLETEVTAVKQVVEKTIKPLARDFSNTRQRIIGFMAAVSLGGMVIGGLWWFVTVGLPQLVQMLKAAAGP